METAMNQSGGLQRSGTFAVVPSSPRSPQQSSSGSISAPHSPTLTDSRAHMYPPPLPPEVEERAWDRFPRQTREFFSALEDDSLPRIHAAIERGFDKSVSHVSGMTPLHYAAYRGHWDLVSMFLQTSPMNVPTNPWPHYNYKGYTAAEMAASPEMSQFIATHCPSSRVPGAQLYWQGMESLRIGQYEDALTKFVRSAKILQSPEAYTGAGKALIETNLPDKALECFNKAISISPTAKDAHILKASLLCSNTFQFQQALADLKNQFLNDVGVLHELAEVLKSKKIYESSLIVYNTILESAPTDIHAIAKKAQVQYAMGEIENGLYGMQQVLIFDSTIEPYSTIFTPILSAHRKIKVDQIRSAATTALLARDWDSALENFIQLVALSPNDDSAHWGAGTALWRTDRLHEALKFFDQAIVLNPSSTATADKQRLIAERESKQQELIRGFEQEQLARIEAAKMKVKTTKQQLGLDALEAAWLEQRSQLNQLLEYTSALQNELRVSSEWTRIKCKHQQSKKAFRVPLQFSPRSAQELVADIKTRFKIPRTSLLSFQVLDMTTKTQTTMSEAEIAQHLKPHQAMQLVVYT